MFFFIGQSFFIGHNVDNLVGEDDSGGDDYHGNTRLNRKEKTNEYIVCTADTVPDKLGKTNMHSDGKNQVGRPTGLHLHRVLHLPGMQVPHLPDAQCLYCHICSFKLSKQLNNC